MGNHPDQKRESSKRILNRRRERGAPGPPLSMAELLMLTVCGGMLLIPMAILIPWVMLARFFESRKLDRLAKARKGESICQFARHFRGDNFDPVVVRAVYEMTQETVLCKTDLPLRPTDHFVDTFGIVDEDLDDLGNDVAALAHRSMEALELNPFYGQVTTLGDLVRFMQHQPRLLA